MKKFIIPLFAIICLSVGSLKAQDMTPPKDGAALRMKSHNHEVKIGDGATTDVWLVRSKKKKKTKFEGLKATAPKGLEINFEASGENPDHYKMQVIANAEVKPGQYMLIIKGDGNNSYQLRGTTCTLTVTE
ncbi:MAG: hypothetical protein AAFN93_19045 [Bacteroidota bacterium]